MRLKIAFLTVLTINAAVFGGYWILRFLGWQAMALMHWMSWKHECIMEGNQYVDHGSRIIDFMAFELFSLVMASVALWIMFAVTRGVYRNIDRRFPGKEK